MAEWIRTDEAEEAVAALESVAAFLRDAGREPLAWRWVIIGLHIAAQGFMVIALRDSAGLIPLQDDVAAAWLQAHEDDVPYPQERLDSFRGLYKKTKSRDIATRLRGSPFTPRGSQGRSVRLLITLRNQLVHFVPSSWSVEIAGLPRICSEVLDMIEYLSSGYRTILWHDGEHPGRITAALQSARRELEAMLRAV